MLESLIKKLIDQTLQGLPSCTASVQSLDIHPLKAQIHIHGLTIHNREPRNPAQRMVFVKDLIVSLHWLKLLSGQLRADLDMEEPAFECDLDFWRLNRLEHPVFKHLKTVPFRWDVAIRQGTLIFKNIPGQGSNDLQMNAINGQLCDVTRMFNILFRDYVDIRIKRPAEPIAIAAAGAISPTSPAATPWVLLKETILSWTEHRSFRMAAALSFYTVFSLAPLILLVIAVAGLVFGRQAAEGRVLEQFGSLIGDQSAQALQSLIANAWQPAKGTWAAVISVVSLLVGASAVLSELKDALNQVWRVREPSDWVQLVKDRALYFALILGIGFLALVSLLLSAALAAMGQFFGAFLSVPKVLLHIADFIFSFGVITSLFAVIFKYLPDAEIKWRHVGMGAAGTALLFAAGKFALGLYLGKGIIGSSYGAAGSILIILLWVYYSSLIFYFGAEFTRVYAEHDIALVPNSH